MKSAATPEAPAHLLYGRSEAEKLFIEAFVQPAGLPSETRTIYPPASAGSLAMHEAPQPFPVPDCPSIGTEAEFSLPSIQTMADTSSPAQSSIAKSNSDISTELLPPTKRKTPDDDHSAKQHRKETHKEVERRRRETINAHIEDLRKILPNCTDHNKGAILRRTAEYIGELQVQHGKDRNEVAQLTARLTHAEQHIGVLKEDIVKLGGNPTESNDCGG